MNSKNILKEANLKQTKAKVDLEDLKSDYFIIKIFGIMKKNKSLEIVKYNKKLQKRLNLGINDYKQYFELFSPIEIELNLADNEYKRYGFFINILDEEKKYYQIYFNDSTKEIKRNFLEENEIINRIKIIINYQVKSFKKLFENCRCIDSIFFKKFHRINITLILIQIM